ncbi:Uncharacterized protein QTN25_000402 [Entamoeba marina]
MKNNTTLTIDNSNEKSIKIVVSIPNSFPYSFIGVLIVALALFFIQIRYTDSNIVYITWIIGIIVLCYLCYSSLTRVNEISLTGRSDKGISIQKLSTISTTGKIQFIPIQVINNVIIHEQIQPYKVVTFIAFTFLKNNVKYTTPFPPLLPIFYEFELTADQKSMIYRSLHTFLRPNFPN